MRTHKTIEEARATAKEVGAVCIIEADHKTEGRIFLAAKAHKSFLDSKVSQIPELKSLIKEYPIKTTEEQESEKRIYLKNNTRCERCSKKIDGNTSYQQKEKMRIGGALVPVTAYYCNDCKAILTAVGAGEYNALQERADDVPSYEPIYKGE